MLRAVGLYAGYSLEYVELLPCMIFMILGLHMNVFISGLLAISACGVVFSGMAGVGALHIDYPHLRPC